MPLTHFYQSYIIICWEEEEEESFNQLTCNVHQLTSTVHKTTFTIHQATSTAEQTTSAIQQIPSTSQFPCTVCQLTSIKYSVSVRKEEKQEEDETESEEGARKPCSLHNWAVCFLLVRGVQNTRKGEVKMRKNCITLLHSIPLRSITCFSFIDRQYVQSLQGLWIYARRNETNFWFCLAAIPQLPT